MATVQDVVDTLKSGTQQMREHGSIAEGELPTDEFIERVIPQVFTDRGRAGLRVRSSAPKDADNAARATLGLLRWFNSGGCLDGLMIARFTAGQEWPVVETLGTLIRVAVYGRDSSPSALDAWKRTGLVD